jgi:hypothetical protein
MAQAAKRTDNHQTFAQFGLTLLRQAIDIPSLFR